MKIKEEYYDLFMSLLAFLVVAMLTIEMTMNLTSKSLYIINIVDDFIWLIFCVDYFIRLTMSKSKKKFILNNKIDLISIIPFNSLFKALRVLKITRVAKLIKITKTFKATVFLIKFKDKIDRFTKTNNFNYVLYMTGVIVGIGAVVISFVEDMELGDALWWSFVTTTTVGYGDLSPVTPIGRIVAAILMLVGIGFIGMLTGTIATFFLSKEEKHNTYKDNIINDAKTKLDNFEDLTREDLRDMYMVLDSLKVKDSSE